MDEYSHSTGEPAAHTQLRNDPEYVAFLERRIAALESRVPRTDLLSPKFIRRAFAVLGHYMVAGLIIYVVVFVALGVVVLLGTAASALFHLGG